MKRITILLFSCFLFSQTTLAQQTIKLFGEKIRAKEITGIKKFNDFGTRFNTSVINDLTDDINTFYWRLGTVRKNKSDYTAGSFSLFDLSNYDHSAGYHILDSIDFTYYEEVGFNILEKNDSSLLSNKRYTAFKSEFKKANLQEKRILLWRNENYEIRNKLFKTKYYINIQPISDEVTSKLTKNISDSLSVNFDEILDKIPGDAQLKTELSTYLHKNKNSTLTLKGEYISAIFRSRYIGIARFIIGGLNPSELDRSDEFNDHLIQYSNDENTFAFNSAIYGFRFEGNYDEIRLDSMDIKNKTTLKTEKIIDIANKFNLELNRIYNRTFKNEFNKLWIIMFATDAGFDELCFNRSVKTPN